jgi:hypothetical protein
MNGERISRKKNRQMMEMVNSGQADAAVLSVMIGGAGLNCQKMNAVIWMAPCFSAAQERQGNGIVWEKSVLTVGRIFRSGQEDPTASTATIMAPKEDIDAVPLARKERNLTEAEAIMEIETNKRDIILVD